MAYSFGQYPLYFTALEDGTYQVSAPDQPKADECGINYNFPPERLDIMIARGASYGYVVSQTFDLQPASK